MTPNDVEEALDLATTQQLIAELLKRPTWQGVVVGTESKTAWKNCSRPFNFQFSKHNLSRKKAIGLIGMMAKKLLNSGE
jgi:hypothetical protein